ncbi:MAG: ComF family protein [Ignavibacteriaceae bacterium]
MLIDFFLPRFCPSCKKNLNENEKYVCQNCLDNIKLADESRLNKEYQRKFFEKNIISEFTSLYVFEKDKELQHIIHSFKYAKKFLIGKFLGELAANHLKEKINNWKIDLIIPIPLHNLKKAERGYNQSFYIAKGLSKILNIPVSENSVKRIKFTESQTTMTLLERQENIGEAFLIKNKKKIEGKNILLIDDVITTGATISECGKILLESRAKKIYAASVAIAD